MISQAIAEVATGVAFGGGFQFVSEGMKIVGNLVSGLSRAAVARDDAQKAMMEAETKAMDAAAKRLPIKLTSIVVLIVFGTIYLLPYLVGLIEVVSGKDMTTTLVEDREGVSILWGLVKYGGGLALQEASGIVQIPEVRSIANLAGGYVLGAKGISTGRRCF